MRKLVYASYVNSNNYDNEEEKLYALLLPFVPALTGHVAMCVMVLES